MRGVEQWEVVIKGTRSGNVQEHVECSHLQDSEYGVSPAGLAVAVGSSLVDAYSLNLCTPLKDSTFLLATALAFLPSASAPDADLFHLPLVVAVLCVEAYCLLLEGVDVELVQDGMPLVD